MKPGDKVKCIEAPTRSSFFGEIGEIYTVKSVFQSQSLVVLEEDPQLKANSCHRFVKVLTPDPSHDQTLWEDNVPDILVRALGGSRGQDQLDIARAGISLVVKVLEKNNDYGSSVFESPLLDPTVTPLQALRARQSDKVKRIIQLAEQPPEVSGESLNDSLDDFCGYNILDLVLRNRCNE